MFNLIHLIMREELLYHIWKFQKFDSSRLFSSNGEEVVVFNPGIQNELAGPDFFNARIKIDEQLWAGNVEIHLKASDWYSHRHNTDPNYENVILHVVWEHDIDVFRGDGSRIPVLELEELVGAPLLDSYNKLIGLKHSRINCEGDFRNFTSFSLEHWLERLFVERLEQKEIPIAESLRKTGNDWETTLFIHLFKSFGLNLNGDCFLALARSIPFRVVQKSGQRAEFLEAIFLGQADLLNEQDEYAAYLEKEYLYLKHKYGLENEFLPRPQFFRLRPNNFPSIRLAQLAALYHQRKNLFSDIISIKSMEELYGLFNVDVSEYWQTHNNFGSHHSSRSKRLSRSFIDLLAINCFIPIIDFYQKYIGRNDEDQIFELVGQISAEKNKQIAVFEDLRPGTTRTAMHSQALLQLKKYYCDKNQCLHCELGASLLNGSANYR